MISENAISLTPMFPGEIGTTLRIWTTTLDISWFINPRSSEKILKAIINKKIAIKYKGYFHKF